MDVMLRAVFQFTVAVIGSVFFASSAKASAASVKSFADAYQLAIARSLRIETQKAEVRASEGRQLAARGNFLPTFGLGVTDTLGAEPRSYGPTYGASLSASLNIFRFGADLAALRASDRNLLGNHEGLRKERQGAETDAADAILGYVANVRKRQIVEKIVQIRADSLQIAHERFNKGLLPMQEVDKVAIDLDNSRASLADALTGEADARAKLKAALGDESVVIEWPWRAMMLKGPLLEQREFKIETRPDWRALKASLEEQTYKSNQAYDSVLPSLDLTWSYGNADLATPDRRDWKALVTLSIPFFNGFKDWATYRVQNEVAQQAEFKLEALKRLAPAEVESLKSNHKLARESALAREKTAQITERLYADNLQRFRMGRANANELALDQDRLLQSQLHEVDGWLSAHTTLVRLCHGLGGFVSPSGECGLD